VEARVAEALVKAMVNRLDTTTITVTTITVTTITIATITVATTTSRTEEKNIKAEAKDTKDTEDTKAKVLRVRLDIAKSVIT